MHIVSRVYYYPWLAWCEWFTGFKRFFGWFLPWFARGFSDWTDSMSQTKPKPLRQTMPTVAAWIDELREAFGTDGINRAIRNGAAGGAQFYAEEGGRSIGCDAMPGGHVVSAAHMVLGRAEGDK